MLHVYLAGSLSSCSTHAFHNHEDSHGDNANSDIGPPRSDPSLSLHQQLSITAPTDKAPRFRPSSETSEGMRLVQGDVGLAIERHVLHERDVPADHRSTELPQVREARDRFLELEVEAWPVRAASIRRGRVLGDCQRKVCGVRRRLCWEEPNAVFVVSLVRCKCVLALIFCMFLVRKMSRITYSLSGWMDNTWKAESRPYNLLQGQINTMWKTMITLNYNLLQGWRIECGKTIVTLTL